MLKRILISCAIISLCMAATSASADCYADYKAKKDDPLRLHYGVVQLPDSACGSRGAAESATAQRIARGGWTLLKVVSIFGPEGLDQRKASAGDYFLRY
ncbi:hypothetical protein DDZ14_09535 [Maritimibacter sp. 55A14]|uniref:hypothetical protein n=1 Tax=Maritimibacter sp. 55A14 TaxID=2174844 RepID=UPI000D60526A|nr:hypothetical protein [Maritimibacter sp. 55A14]PWE32624.1 hypothetical protein DDZ14_09535 [Maritimibacter sp. 55A14]